MSFWQVKVSSGIVPFPFNEIRQCGYKPTAQCTQVEDVCMGHPNLFQNNPTQNQNNTSVQQRRRIYSEISYRNFVNLAEKPQYKRVQLNDHRAQSTYSFQIDKGQFKKEVITETWRDFMRLSLPSCDDDIYSSGPINIANIN